ncbi:sensor histidine kinase [Croceicoccus mobilis]|uniref:histidine kinase n=1 Tax=Croceicoccus mobilis TaxID=1703339 RepID=A0A916Z4W9_9SPHN|nr:ATP-binding protein [Croceicoccus mobilis]GGD76344.1 hypothetical protein GCM10010990_27490 [Croceicoccus mobilis]
MGDTVAITGAKAPLIARSDAADRMVEADDRLAALQRACGGDIPGMIAVPELLQLVRKARGYNMKLGRSLTMIHPAGSLSGWAEIEPGENGCTIRLSDWTAAENEAEPAHAPSDEAAETRLAIEQLLAEAVLWLDERQNIVALETECVELSPLVGKARQMRGQNWASLFELDGGKPPQWGVRSGIVGGIEGSQRRWHLMMAGGAGQGGNQLLIRRHEEVIASEPANDEDLLPDKLLADQLAPALDAPVRRIIRNGEIMRDRLAGPLAREYVSYAGDIVSAGQHLAGLAQALVDGDEAPEPELTTLDLCEIAEGACRLLTTRAARRQARFALRFHPAHAQGDRRWCMQILLNLLGNAVNYGPKGGEIFIDCSVEGNRARVSITDQGTTLSAQERELIFGKYERLGREEGGTGLGLHISRRLSEAMGGTLEVTPADGGGNCFTLRLPVAGKESQT